MEHRLASPNRAPSLGQALNRPAIDRQAASLPPQAPAPAAEEVEDGRLLRLALLPLAACCVSVVLDLSAAEMLWAVVAAGCVAGVLALRR